MENKPEISDDEIRSYMDFENLVKARKLAGKLQGNKLVWMVLPMAVVTSVAVWYFSYQPGNQLETATVSQKEKPAPPTESTPQVAQNEARKIQKDSIRRLPVPTKQVITPSQAEFKGKEKKSEQQKTIEDVYVQAEPTDGFAKLYAYFNASMQYPIESISDSIQGVETVSFTIDPSGKPIDILIKQSLGRAFDDEAIRVIRNMPSWKPATLNGKPVASQMSIPLTFQIENVRSRKP